MAPGGFWKKTYVIHPGIGVARIGGPDPCRATTDQIIALNNAVASVEAALPTLSGSELAEAKKLIAVDKAKLTQLQTSLAACRQKPEDFFVGPEVPDEAFVPPNHTYRTAGGAIRRQAARFRIYEYAVFTPMLGPRPSPARRSKVTVREITANEADIQWHVHLANLKSTNQYGQMMANDPGPQTVSGMKQSIDVTGTIFGHDLLLGTLKTDEAGRLMVLGGFGTSRSTAAAKVQGVSNQVWYDDMSDGPVWATIKLFENGAQPIVEPAWVLVGVPRFAHPISSIVTLYDVAYEAARSLPAPYTLTPPVDVSFTRDIYPLLRRPVLMQWVNASAATGHGPGGPADFFGQQLFDNLIDNNKNSASQAYQDRQWVFKSLRNPAGPWDYSEMPSLHGGLTLTPFQYDRMKRWADGDFNADWTGPPAVVPFAQLTPAQQAEALDMAGLVTTVGGGFEPGIEGGEIMRHSQTYERPFRISHDLAPGSLTASLAVPWQGDYTACGEDWWPAGRPNRATQDGGTFYPWLPKDWSAEDTVANWWKLGFITKKQIANKDAYVETERLL